MTPLVVVLLTFLLFVSGYSMYVAGQKWQVTRDQVWVVLIFLSMAGILVSGYWLNIVVRGLM